MTDTTHLDLAERMAAAIKGLADPLPLVAQARAYDAAGIVAEDYAPRDFQRADRAALDHILASLHEGIDP